MRYSTEPRLRKYVKWHSFLSCARKFGDKYGKKLMDTATKTGIDAAKAASKRVVQKNCRSYSRFDWKQNSWWNYFSMQTKRKNKAEEIYIPPEKRQQIIDDLRLFWA